LIIGSVVSPADVRYIKNMIIDWGSADEFILFPDISETLDAPRVENPPRITEGGTPLEDVVDTANSRCTLTIGGRFQSSSAGEFLEREFRVPQTALPLPIGLKDTDLFVSMLEEQTGIALPERYEAQRGRLLDTLADVHKYLAGVRVAVYGDSDIALGLTRFLCEAGAIPAVVATGSRSTRFEAEIRAASEDALILLGADFSQIHDQIRNARIDLMLGTSNGRQISKKEGIPLVRVGLPNHDRVGATRQLLVGYEGSALLADAITNALLDEGSRVIS
jgi:nitrogenase molybdenum-iron protein NifN